ncbi:MAG TPA: protein-disulfide reductase DsbD domain-containing protein [Flavisolibacter sp.]|jgi:thiol:disulfide interchange protein DsbD|nr:protein-disulfide reductase DsbD domain-containing protein [Flavisolibacter sp.]
MKKFLFAAFALIAFQSSFAQNLNPVNWSFTTKKIADKVYEVQLTATIQQGWHLYSQQQPEDAIAQPTTFTFNRNPLLELDGKVKEVGKLEKFKDAKLEVSANQYSNKVVFVQRVKLKGKAKTNITGNLEFQTCNDQKCLPPKTVNFSIAL